MGPHLFFRGNPHDQYFYLSSRINSDDMLICTAFRPYFLKKSRDNTGVMIHCLGCPSISKSVYFIEFHSNTDQIIFKPYIFFQKIRNDKCLTQHFAQTISSDTRSIMIWCTYSKKMMKPVVETAVFDSMKRWVFEQKQGKTGLKKSVIIENQSGSYFIQSEAWNWSYQNIKKTFSKYREKCWCFWHNSIFHFHTFIW